MMFVLLVFYDVMFAGNTVTPKSAAQENEY